MAFLPTQAQEVTCAYYCLQAFQEWVVKVDPQHAAANMQICSEMIIAWCSKHDPRHQHLLAGSPVNITQGTSPICQILVR